MEIDTLRLRSPYHFRRVQHVSRVREILQSTQAGITDLLDDIPAEGCDCRFEYNSRRILLSIRDLEKQMEELRDALVQAGIRHDN